MRAHDRSARKEDPDDHKAAARRAPVDPGGLLALQRSAGNQAVTDVISRGLSEPAAPMGAELLAQKEEQFNANFSGVRFHTGAAAAEAAAAVHARAFTVDQDIVLPDPDPETLDHELTHVVRNQQRRATGHDTGAGFDMTRPTDEPEQEAAGNARQMRGGGRSMVQGNGPGTETTPVVATALIQRTALSTIQPGITEAQESHLDTNLLDMPVLVPVLPPVATDRFTRDRSANLGGATDDRLTSDASGDWWATITWRQLIRGDVIPMRYEGQILRVLPQGGGSLAAARGELLQIRHDPRYTSDPLLNEFTSNLMRWLLRQQGGGGQAEVAVTATSSAAGRGAHVDIEGRPGWNTPANEIATDSGEQRRHIFAWHAMRDAFRRAFNTALADGEHVRDRMRRLISLLEQAETWAELDNNSDDGHASGDESMADAGSRSSNAMSGVVAEPGPSSQPDEMALDTPPRSHSPVPAAGSPAHSSSQASSTTSEQLRDRLTEVITRVMGLLSNNPYNLWAGEGRTNEAINRVAQQLRLEMREQSDDQELLTSVRERATNAAARPGQDRQVWTTVRDMLADAQAGDARKFIQSIIDTTDVDVPITGDDETSSTYEGNLANQVAVVQHMLGSGMSTQLIAMGAGTMPADFDTLLGEIGAWLRRFLRPDALATSTTGGNRTVHQRS